MPTIRIKIAQGEQVPTKLTHGELGICNDRLYFGKKGDIPQAVVLPGDRLANPALLKFGDQQYDGSEEKIIQPLKFGERHYDGSQEQTLSPAGYLSIPSFPTMLATFTSSTKPDTYA